MIINGLIQFSICVDFMFIPVEYKFILRNKDNINIIKQKLKEVYLYIITAGFVLFRRISGNILN